MKSSHLSAKRKGIRKRRNGNGGGPHGSGTMAPTPGGNLGIDPNTGELAYGEWYSYYDSWCGNNYTTAPYADCDLPQPECSIGHHWPACNDDLVPHENDCWCRCTDNRYWGNNTGNLLLFTLNHCGHTFRPPMHGCTTDQDCHQPCQIRCATAGMGSNIEM